MGMAIIWWLKTRQAASCVSLKAFDTSTPEGRSKERYRRVALTSITAIAAKGIGILTALISVPLTIGYLGIERYGLWMTISSVIALLSFADLGIGNGLLNAVAEADGKDDCDAASRYVSSAFFILLGIAIFLLVLLISIYSFVSWQRVYNVTSDLAVREAGSATALLLVIAIINMPLGVVQRVQMGYQEGVKNHIWAIAGSLIGFVGLLIAVYFKCGLQWLVLAVSGGPMLVMLINWFREFAWLKPWLFPHWSAFDWETGCKIVSAGILFLILQMFAIIGSASDNIIISQVLGASEVASYAVTQKLFSITMIAQFFILPLWPAFGEAMARNDTVWARRTLNRSLILSLVLGVLTAFPLLLFGKQIIARWAGTALIPSTIMLIGFALWVLLAGYVGSMSSFLNIGSLLRRQTVFYGAASIVSLILKIVLTKLWLTPSGVIWATVFGYSSFYAIPAAVLAYGRLRQNHIVR